MPRRVVGFGVLKYRLIAFLAVFGPGFITANVDNDPGGILTYSQAGAKYGYTLLWTLIPTTLALIVIQEMAARMGVVTGKGLSDLIREEFGLRATFITTALENGAQLEDVQKAAGHRAPTTTKLYDRRGYNPDKAASFFATY